MLAWIDAFETTNALDGPFLQGVAADGIHRVGRVDDDTAFFQDFDDAGEILGVVVFFVEFNQHILACFRMSF